MPRVPQHGLNVTTNLKCTDENRFFVDGLTRWLLLGIRKFCGALIQHIHISSKNSVHMYLSSIFICECSSFSRIAGSCVSSSKAEPQPNTRARSLPVPNGNTPIWHWKYKKIVISTNHFCHCLFFSDFWDIHLVAHCVT